MKPNLPIYLFFFFLGNKINNRVFPLQVTHMPPELLTEGHLSKAADVYSFGVMLWEM